MPLVTLRQLIVTPLLPMFTEIYANLLGVVKSPTSALASMLQAPTREIVMVLKAYVKKLEEDGGARQ